MGEQVASLNRWRCVIVCLVAFWTTIGRGSFGEADFHAGAAELRITMGVDTGGGRDLSVLDGERLVMSYHYAELGLSVADVPMKPCVDQVGSRRPAMQVLRDSPPDHKHHHALMFAVAVDGANFWEENPRCNGRRHQRRRAAQGDHRNEVDGAAMASTAPDSPKNSSGSASIPDKPLMVERRDDRSAEGGRSRRHSGRTGDRRLQTPPGKDVDDATPAITTRPRHAVRRVDGRRRPVLQRRRKDRRDRSRRRAAHAHQVVRLHRQGRRQAGHRGHLRPSQQSPLSGQDVHDVHALRLSLGHAETNGRSRLW